MIRQIAMFAGGQVAVVTLTDISISDDPPSGNSYAAVQFRTDGTLWKDTSVGGPLQISASTDWIIPNDAASIVHEVRFLSGHGGDAFTTPPSTEDNWIAISTTREYRLDQVAVPGVKTGVYTFEIRRGSGAVLDTADITITATRT